MGVPARWKRRIAYGSQKEGEGGDNERKDDRKEDERKAYTTRLLACTRCGHHQETRWMQLRTKDGYRAVHCPACHKQERTQRSRCQCGHIWHQCTVHRVDPVVHRSRRAPKKTEDERKASSREVEGKAKRAGCNWCTRSCPFLVSHQRLCAKSNAVSFWVNGVLNA